MAKRAYGQYCGFARALEVVGERWALLIVRDLLGGPKRFTDLGRGLPGIPTNILSARLKELEEAGVIRRRILPRPGGSVGYELTEYGSELQDVVLGLGRWGAKALGEPRPEEIVTPDSLMVALQTTFQPQAARKERVGYELRVGPIVIHARVDRGKLEVANGTLVGADLVIEAGPEIRALLAGDITPQAAIDSGIVSVSGDSNLLANFVKTFHIDAMPGTASS